MSEDEQRVIDIKTRKAITCIKTEPDTRPEKFLQNWKRFCKDTKVKSVMIITINEDDYINHGFVMESEFHEALAIMAIDDLKDEMRDNFFEYDE